MLVVVLVIGVVVVWFIGCIVFVLVIVWGLVWFVVG